jgi:hypothetical protein
MYRVYNWSYLSIMLLQSDLSLHAMKKKKKEKKMKIRFYIIISSYLLIAPMSKKKS